MSLLHEIEKAQERKRTLLAEIAAIDDELERAKLAIAGKSFDDGLRIHRQPRPVEIRREGSVPNEILAALTAKEPRTITDLASYTRRGAMTLQNHLSAMASAGQIVRRRLEEGSGRPMIYARTESALYPNPEPVIPVAADEESAAEAG